MPVCERIAWETGMIFKKIIPTLTHGVGNTGADWDSAPEQTGTLLMLQHYCPLKKWTGLKIK